MAKRRSKKKTTRKRSTRGKKASAKSADAAPPKDAASRPADAADTNAGPSSPAVKPAPEAPAPVHAGAKAARDAGGPEAPCDTDAGNIIGPHLWQIRWVRDLATILGVAGVVWLAYSIRGIIIPVLVALGLAYITDPLVDWARQRYNVRRITSTSLLLVIVFSLFTMAGLLILPGIIAETVKLQQRFPRYRANVLGVMRYFLPEQAEEIDQIQHILDDEDGGADATAPDARQSADAADASPTPPNEGAAENADDGSPTGDQFRTAAQPRGPPADASNGSAAPDTTDAQVFRELATSDIQALTSFAIGTLNIGGQVVGRAIGLTTYFIMAAFIIAFCFFFFSWKFDAILAWFDQFIPTRNRERTLQIIRRMDRSIAAFVRGRLLQSVIMSVILTTGWALVGAPHPLLLGIATGMLNIVPYLASVGAILATGLVLADQAGQPQFNVLAPVLVLLIYAAAQALDGWAIEPYVQGKATDLDPLTVLLSVLVGGALAGLFGLLLAIPVAACLKILSQEVILPRLRRWIDAWE